MSLFDQSLRVRSLAAMHGQRSLLLPATLPPRAPSSLKRPSTPGFKQASPGAPPVPKEAPDGR